ncbi:hypothetical protein V8E36_007113 [Tilletia maclaganii]
MPGRLPVSCAGPSSLQAARCSHPPTDTDKLIDTLPDLISNLFNLIKARARSQPSTHPSTSTSSMSTSSTKSTSSMVVLLHPSTSPVKLLIVKHRQVQGHPIQPSGPVTKVVRWGGPAEELHQTQWMRRIRTPAGADLLRLPTVYPSTPSIGRTPRRSCHLQAPSLVGLVPLDATAWWKPISDGRLRSTAYHTPSTQSVLVVVTTIELIFGILDLIDMILSTIKAIHLIDDFELMQGRPATSASTLQGLDKLDAVDVVEILEEVSTLDVADDPVSTLTCDLHHRHSGLDLDLTITLTVKVLLNSISHRHQGRHNNTTTSILDLDLILYRHQC